VKEEKKRKGEGAKERRGGKGKGDELPIEIAGYATSSCKVCQKTKSSKHKKKAPLKPVQVVEPFAPIQLNFVGPFKECDGFKHVLVIVDSSSFWLEFFRLNHRLRKKSHIFYTRKFLRDLESCIPYKPRQFVS